MEASGAQIGPQPSVILVEIVNLIVNVHRRLHCLGDSKADGTVRAIPTLLRTHTQAESSWLKQTYTVYKLLQEPARSHSALSSLIEAYASARSRNMSGHAAVKSKADLRIFLVVPKQGQVTVMLKLCFNRCDSN